MSFQNVELQTINWQPYPPPVSTITLPNNDIAVGTGVENPPLKDSTVSIVNSGTTTTLSASNTNGLTLQVLAPSKQLTLDGGDGIILQNGNNTMTIFTTHGAAGWLWPSSNGNVGQVLTEGGRNNPLTWTDPSSGSVLFQASTLATVASVTIGSNYIFSNSNPNPVVNSLVADTIPMFYIGSNLIGTNLQINVSISSNGAVDVTQPVTVSLWRCETSQQVGGLQYNLFTPQTITYSGTEVNGAGAGLQKTLAFTPTDIGNYVFAVSLTSGFVGWNANGAIAIAGTLQIV